MATYREILAGETDVDSPVTTALATAWSDNPVAIAEGAAGAPRIQTGAYPETTAGGVAKFQSSGSITVDTENYDVVFRAKMAGRGGVRLEVSYRSSYPGRRVFIEISVNDVVLAEYNMTAISAVTQTHDISYSPGDRIKLRARAENGGPGVLEQVILRTGGEDIYCVNGITSTKLQILGGSWR